MYTTLSHILRLTMKLSTRLTMRLTTRLTTHLITRLTMQLTMQLIPTLMHVKIQRVHRSVSIPSPSALSQFVSSAIASVSCCTIWSSSTTKLHCGTNVDWAGMGCGVDVGWDGFAMDVRWTRMWGGCVGAVGFDERSKSAYAPWKGR